VPEAFASEAGSFWRRTSSKSAITYFSMFSQIWSPSASKLNQSNYS
jgi:hypothetical protein